MEEEAEIDEFWCVFDVEWPLNHPSLKEAIERARKNDIRLAVSNPCFELWLILHFQDQRAWLDNDEARRLRRKLDGSDDKGLETAKYMLLTSAAARRAEALEQRHIKNGADFAKDNPSSGMHRLLAAIQPAETGSPAKLIAGDPALAEASSGLPARAVSVTVRVGTG